MFAAGAGRGSAQARWTLWRDLLAGTGAFVAGCVVWFVPLLRSVDWSLRQLVQPLETQAAYVRTADSMLGQTVTRTEVLDRLASFGSVFSGYFGGPRQGGLNAFLSLAAALVVLGLLAGRRRSTWLAVVWLLTYGAVMVLVMQPTDPRKVLPALPPMFLLLGAAGARLQRKHAGERGARQEGWLPLGGTGARFQPWRLAGPVVVLLLTAAFAGKGLPLVRMLHTQPTPPEQAVRFIQDYYSSDDTIILAGNSLNHVYYELPEYDSVAIDFVTAGELASQLENARYRYVISLDEWDTTVPLPPDWVRGQTLVFERDPLVLPKAAMVPFTVYWRH